MTDDELKGLFEGLREDNAAVRGDETRRHFERFAERMDAKFEALAEMLAGLKESLDRRFDGLEETIRRTAAETQAVIKSLNTELDPPAEASH